MVAAIDLDHASHGEVLALQAGRRERHLHNRSDESGA
jgi:hypothetical protein